MSRVFELIAEVNRTAQNARETILRDLPKGLVSALRLLLIINDRSPFGVDESFLIMSRLQTPALLLKDFVHRHDSYVRRLHDNFVGLDRLILVGYLCRLR